MLHQNEIVSESNIESDLDSVESISDLEQLRKLLLGSEYQDLLLLQREFSDHSHASEKISQVISEAIAIRSKQDNSISNALVPSVEDAIHASVKRNPKRLANALFPVVGPAIRESVAETVSAMMQQVNQLLEKSLSARSIKWRIDALRTNRTFAEVMLSETLVYQVEQVFLIHRETSLLINHLTSANAIIKDPDMVSGMLTAVTDFVKDSFVVDKQQSVKSIKFGQLNLLFEAGPYAIIVAAVRGLIPSDLQVTLREQVEELHRLYGSQLENYDGNSEKFPDTFEQLNKCLLSKKKNSDRRGHETNKLPWLAIIALSLLILFPCLLWIQNKIEQNTWQEAISHLQAEPGIIILDHHKEDEEYVVNGLRDPLAKNPVDIVAFIPEFQKPVKFNMQAYYSNEPEILKQRIHKVLEPPSTVTTKLENGNLVIRGKAKIDWIADLSKKLPFIWGINSIDTSQLREIEDLELKIVQLIGLIEGVVIEFTSNSSVLNSNGIKSVSYLADQIKALRANVEKAGRTFKLGILGFADLTGSPATNNEISERRARAVYRELMRHNILGNDLLAKGLGSYLTQSEVNRTLSCDSQRCVVFEVYLN